MTNLFIAMPSREVTVKEHNQVIKFTIFTIVFLSLRAIQNMYFHIIEIPNSVICPLQIFEIVCILISYKKLSLKGVFL